VTQRRPPRLPFEAASAPIPRARAAAFRRARAAAFRRARAMAVAWVAFAGCGPCNPSTDAPVEDGPAPGAAVDALSRAPLPADGGPPEADRCPEARHAESSCFDLVPAGTFLMGAQAADPAAPGHDPAALTSEGPVHAVTLPAFWLMRYEATASLWRQCVQNGGCQADDALADDAGAGTRDNGPVVGLSWDGARRLCAHLGGRLPTEAEWERAARGDDGRRWPWGSEPSCGHLVGERAHLDPGRPIGQAVPRPGACATTAPPAISEHYETGPYGTHALAGGVWEWVADVWHPAAYAQHAATAPRHDGPPPEGEALRRVQRGGSHISDDPMEWRAALRDASPPDAQLPDVGARCVWDPAAAEAAP
jgi:sulfatase modifying factor 1